MNKRFSASLQTWSLVRVSKQKVRGPIEGLVQLPPAPQINPPAGSDRLIYTQAALSERLGGVKWNLSDVIPQVTFQIHLV